MTIKIIIGLLALLISLSGAAADCDLEGKVIKVSDGDTVKILDADNKIHRLRLAGIDAPEGKQAFGKVSGRFLSKMVSQKTVCVKGNKRDRYQRLVGVIHYQGIDVNLEMVESGLAWHYKKYQKEQTKSDREIYANAEKMARSNVIGLWSEPSPIKPSDWRKGKRRAKPKKPTIHDEFKCGEKRFCSEMSSCEEAKYYLTQCGLNRIDGNNDGIPCSKLCR